MSPSHSCFNSADLAGSNPVVFGYLFLHSAVCADGKHLRGGKFCGTAPLTSVRCSMLHAVSLIVACCVPSKIAKSIVGLVSVIVARLMVLFRWAAKSKQNQTMHLKEPAFILAPKHQAKSPILLARRWFFDAPCFKRPHAAKVGHFVQALVANYRKPFFHSISLENAQSGAMGYYHA